LSHIGQWARQAVELSADAVLIVDQAGHIVYLNQQTEWLFGFAREDLVGQAVELLLPVDARQSHAALRATFMEAPHPRTMGTGLDLVGRRKDGDVFPIDVSLSPLVLGANRYIVTAIREPSATTPLPDNTDSRHEVILPFVQTLLNHVPYGVQVLYGPQGRLLVENRYVARLWGVPWPAWQPMEQFLTAIDADPHAAAIRIGGQCVGVGLEDSRTEKEKTCHGVPGTSGIRAG
jgi:PAS domain S-box-containing protein